MMCDPCTTIEEHNQQDVENDQRAEHESRIGQTDIVDTLYWISNIIVDNATMEMENIRTNGALGLKSIWNVHTE